MATIVDLDTGQVLGIVDGRDRKGVGDWLFARPLQWRLGVQVVAIDPSAAFRKALRMRLPRTAVAVDHLVSLANQAMTEARQNLSQQVKGRGVDKAWAHRMLLLGAGNTLTDKAAHRLEEVFAAHDATGKLEAVRKVEEQLRLLILVVDDDVDPVVCVVVAVRGEGRGAVAVNAVGTVDSAGQPVQRRLVSS
jgi:transposase